MVRIGFFNGGGGQWGKMSPRSRSLVATKRLYKTLCQMVSPSVINLRSGVLGATNVDLKVLV